MSSHERLVYERDDTGWYDEYIDDEFEDDGSVIYADGSEDKVRTIYDKDMKLLGVQL